MQFTLFPNATTSDTVAGDARRTPEPSRFTSGRRHLPASLIEDAIRRLENGATPEPNSGCMLWTGDFDPNGYGRVYLGGKKYLAHRVSWHAATGQDPGAFFVCHKCDVPACINPAHLFLGTCADNNLDKWRKGRAARLLGEKHGGAKFGRKEAIAILSDPRKHREIARDYGVSHVTISRIKGGKRWPHLQASR